MGFIKRIITLIALFARLPNFITGSNTPNGYKLFLARKGENSLYYPSLEIFQKLEIGHSVNHISVSQDGTLILLSTDNQTSFLYKLKTNQYQLINTFHLEILEHLSANFPMLLHL